MLYFYELFYRLLKICLKFSFQNVYFTDLTHNVHTLYTIENYNVDQSKYFTDIFTNKLDWEEEYAKEEIYNTDGCYAVNVITE